MCPAAPGNPGAVPPATASTPGDTTTSFDPVSPWCPEPNCPTLGANLARWGWGVGVGGCAGAGTEMGHKRVLGQFPAGSGDPHHSTPPP